MAVIVIIYCITCIIMIVSNREWSGCSYVPYFATMQHGSFTVAGTGFHTLLVTQASFCASILQVDEDHSIDCGLV